MGWPRWRALAGRTTWAGNRAGAVASQNDRAGRTFERPVARAFRGLQCRNPKVGGSVTVPAAWSTCPGRRQRPSKCRGLGIGARWRGYHGPLPKPPQCPPGGYAPGGRPAGFTVRASSGLGPARGSASEAATQRAPRGKYHTPLSHRHVTTLMSLRQRRRRVQGSSWHASAACASNFGRPVNGTDGQVRLCCLRSCCEEALLWITTNPNGT
jgi:hypothetical protein